MFAATVIGGVKFVEVAPGVSERNVVANESVVMYGLPFACTNIMVGLFGTIAL